MSYSRLSQLKTRIERSLQLYFATTIYDFEIVFLLPSVFPEGRNPQILWPKFASNFSWWNEAPQVWRKTQQPEICCHHKPWRTERTQRGEPALRRHFAPQRVSLMLCQIPDFACSVTLLDQIHQKIALRLYGFDCRAGDGGEVWETAAEEKERKTSCKPQTD